MREERGKEGKGGREELKECGDRYGTENNVATKADIRGWWPHITENLEPTEARSKKEVLLSESCFCSKMPDKQLPREGRACFWLTI